MIERDVVLAKVSVIDRCISRIDDVRGERGRTLLPLDVEDIVAVNLQRAAQAAIDLAAHVVAAEGFGLPTGLAEAFTLLEKNGVIDAALAGRMRKMVGFRNIAVHPYETLDPAIVESIVTRHLPDLRAFGDAIVSRYLLEA